MAVYFIRAGEAGPVKIGSTADLAGRLRELQCGNHEVLVLLRTIDGGAREERFLHKLFAEFRLRGEWFSLDAAAVEAIEAPAIAEMATETWQRHLRRAIAILGSQSKLAAALNVAQAHVSYWLITARVLPAEYAIPIEKATGGEVTRHDLRPDIFDQPSAVA